MAGSRSLLIAVTLVTACARGASLPPPPTASVPAVAPVPVVADTPRAVSSPTCRQSPPSGGAAGTPIGGPYELLKYPAGRVHTVVARPGRAELAVIVDSPEPHVELSVDGGRTFSPVLAQASTAPPRVVIGCDGRVFAAYAHKLGTRDPSGTETWHDFPAPSTRTGTALFDVAGTLVWFVGDAIAVSQDGGATWRSVADDVAHKLTARVPDHRFTVAGHELDHVVVEAWTAKLSLVRFDPSTATATDEPITVAYADDVPWMTATRRAGTWDVRIRCLTKLTPTGDVCREAPAQLADYDRAAVAALLPRLVGGSSYADLPMAWCRNAWSGGEACDLLSVREGNIVREPYTGSPGSMLRKLPETPTTGYALPHSFTLQWLAGFDGDGTVLSGFAGYLMRWSAEYGWRVLPIDDATSQALAAAASPPKPTPEQHPLAGALRTAFGANIWSCARDGCSLKLVRVRCTETASSPRCTALDANDGGRELRVAGQAASAAIAALKDDGVDAGAANIDCDQHEAGHVHCDLVIAEGDRDIDRGTASLQITSLGQHSRTPSSLAVRCTRGTCAFPEQDAAISGDDASALARAVALRLGKACQASRPCDVTAHVSCESSGGFYDGGLTFRLACSVAP